MKKDKTISIAQKYIDDVAKRKGKVIDIKFNGKDPRTALISLDSDTQILLAGCFANALEYQYKIENNIDPRVSVG